MTFSSGPARLYICLQRRHQIAQVRSDQRTVNDQLKLAGSLHSCLQLLTWLGKYISMALMPMFCGRDAIL